jgi:1-acyl-sn-glycerol-3-phosphate acyltransferase
MRRGLISLAVWIGIAGLLVLVWLACALSVLLAGWWDLDRRLAHTCVKLWARAVIALNPYWQLRIDDRARLDPRRAYVFVANHQSLADIVVLPHVGPAYKCVSKAGAFGLPFLGWTLSLCRHIPLRRGSVASTRRAMERARWWIRRGMPVAFFPEGTRSRTGRLQPFKPGAFRLAVETGTPIVPLAISGTRDALPRGSWRFQHKVHGTLTILPPIPTRGLGPEAVDRVKQQAFEAIAAVLQRHALAERARTAPRTITEEGVGELTN